MRSLTHLFWTMLFVLCIGVSPAFSQASSSTAELRGQVTDTAGAAIPNATVTITDTSKGTSRTTTTDDDGSYVFLNLLPSSYELKVEAASKGFAPSTTRIELTVGQQANIPVQLGAGDVTASINIVGGQEVVETDRTQQSSVVDERQITNLPISRRNYLDYALLTPGVSDADNISDASDFRVAQTPQSGLSFGGNNGRGNLVAVDGGETNTVSGGVQTTVNQEAVQEFQVLRNSYNAEFGGASGGIVNIISKSGSNRWSGSLFGLFRNETFDARNAFDFNPNGKSPFSRQQYGGSLGGPIKSDKTFFFTSLERFSQDETTFVNLLNDPSIFGLTASQTSLFNYLATTPFAALATGLSG
ncbi:MAG: carboxypeptidase regulatory-like domain-containing protein, partial [Pyrinomonadaceae bacterium]|nr:carboxypeptidase regulatory-like domain-containing protein [Pyrinomonadaceae bacterium]